MDAGRLWALETFGEFGPKIREEIAEMVKQEHVASLDAQDASKHRSHGVYGQFWRGILEKFETFGRYPGASMVRPGEAPYKLPVVNGVALFPWRFAKSRETELAETPFGTSDARVAITNLRPTPVQETLELGLPDADLSEEERELLATFKSVTKDSMVTSGRLVLVAISSSVRGLFAVDWGQMELDRAGFVAWTGYRESLLSVVPTRPASLSPSGSFTTGELPNKFPQSTKVAATTDE